MTGRSATVPREGTHGHGPHMNFFGATVDGKARSILGDLPENPSPYEILRTVDQKAGDDLDPNDVVAEMRNLDDAVDAKLSAIDGDDTVNQRSMRDAADRVADRTPLSYPDAMDLLDAMVTAIESEDPTVFVDAFDAKTTGERTDEPTSSSEGDGGVDGVDQNAATSEPDSDSSQSMTGANTNDSTDTDTPDDGDVDQKQTDGDGDGDAMNPIDLVEEIGGSDARSTVEEYAESVGKDPEEAAAEWVAENVPGVSVEGYDDDAGGDASPPADAAGDPGADMNTTDDGVDRSAGAPDQKQVQNSNIQEKVADAVTSDAVLDELATAVGQKLVEDDDLADNLVETVDQKGDFATTGDITHEAASSDAQTVEEKRPMTGGDDA